MISNYFPESQHKKAILEKRLTPALTAITKVYDFVTLPVYAALQHPWKQLAKHRALKVIYLPFALMRHFSTIYCNN